MWRSLVLSGGAAYLLRVAAHGPQAGVLPCQTPSTFQSSRCLRSIFHGHGRKLPGALCVRPQSTDFLQGTAYLPLTTLYRNYKSDAVSTVELPAIPLTVTEIKQYLRSKDIPFHDGYSCLHAPSIFVEPSGVPAGKDTYAMFIDKTTGQFLCKDTLVEGSWADLQDCLEVMQKEDRRFLSSHLLLGYAESPDEREEKERELAEVQRIWGSSVPFSDLSDEEAQLVKTMFQVRATCFSAVCDLELV